MNMLEALVILRQVAACSQQMATKRGVAALKVVDRKIQSLLRKKAWRDGCGAMPIHMGQDGFEYPIPRDPVPTAWIPITAAPPEGQVVALHFTWGEVRDGWRLPDGRYRTASMPIPQDTETITHWMALPPGSPAEPAPTPAANP